MATRLHAAHVYKHDPTAMLVFVAFYTRNLKPAVRRNVSMLHLSRLILAELYRAIPVGPSRTPM